MAHFPRIRLAGLWLTGSVLQPGEMEQFDANQSKAINGDDGGPWSPSSPIEIGGSGIKITGLAEFTGEFKVTTEAKLQGGALITGGDLTVAQDITLQGNLDAAGNADVGGNLGVNGSTSIVGNLSVEGISVLQDDVGIDGALTVAGGSGLGGAPEAGFAAKVTGNCKVTGTCTIGSNLTVDGAVTLNAATLVANDLGVTGALTVNGTTKAKGRFKRRVLVMGNANASVSVSDYDMVFMPVGVMTADRTLNISTAGAEEGDVFRVATNDSTYLLNIDWVDSNASIKVASDKQRWWELTFVGGVWVTTAIGDRSA